MIKSKKELQKVADTEPSVKPDCRILSKETKYLQSPVKTFEFPKEIDVNKFYQCHFYAK